jgi:transcriptional regulator with XRE-family HTH domain
MKNENIKSKLNQLTAGAPESNWKRKVEQNRKDRAWLKKSAQIAIKINQTLSSLKMTQRELATKLEVSPQQVSKIVKGKENLTLETITKLEAALGINIISILKANEVIVSTPPTNYLVSASGVSTTRLYSVKSEVKYQKAPTAEFQSEEVKMAIAC